jgi:hypothetical protein
MVQRIHSLRTSERSAVIFYREEKYTLSCAEIFSLSFTTGISHVRDGLLRLTPINF